MSSNEASSGVIYTSIYSDYEEPSDAGDDDDDDLSGDDADNKDEEEASKKDEEEDEDEEEEHLALADSTAISLTFDHVPSVEEIELFETDESTATPPPPPTYCTTSRMSVRSQEPIPFPSEAKVARLLALATPLPFLLTPLSSPLPQIPSPPTHTSLTYTESPLGYRAVRIRLRAASPQPLPLPPPSSPLLLPSNRRADIIEAMLLPQKRLCDICQIIHI
uniref:Uncharacterized protein n=1 Tax=Tanacetum cinerariifolium TaxID=118510 RepID=A0A699H689_TANCI|nr:hypothetical protein [Tanacetum cinerariifolium]